MAQHEPPVGLDRGNDVTIDDSVVRRVVEESPDGLLLCAQDGSIVFVNEALCRLTGYRADQLLGHNVDMLVPLDSRANHHALRTNYVRDPRPRPMGRGLTLQAMRADGTLVAVEISLSPVVRNEDKLTIASVRDITERLEEAERLRNTQEMLALSSERERIARDLHDTVLQRLFGLGLELQAVAMNDVSPNRARLETAVDEIDTIIKEIRTSVFTLGAARREGSLGQELGDIIAQSARVLGFSPRLSIQGPVENLISASLRPDLTAVLREALANVARHARANQVFVDIEVRDYKLVLRIVDNGIGLPSRDGSASGNGLNNLHTRAAAHRGTCRVESGPDGGTTLEWTVPIV